MKKKILLLSAAGIAAGLVYALESNRRKRVTGDAELSGTPKSSESLPTLTAASANPNDSGGTGERGASSPEKTAGIPGRVKSNTRSTIWAPVKLRLHTF